ncbi:transcriptional regulator, AraC family [Subdoligranulum variabile DSM 15176]|uniref:Transcriptional regulator, AraC family n=1 Tax=Subdoligranulum variabile DSM 15176 TaxID=411471 RepID=D1PI59_9FIRM|nr:transcriptional regulator, AraC family [Subdoligranulum variabile DSM 15176]
MAPFTIQKREKKGEQDVGAVFDKKELRVLLQDFYELTGLRTVVFDEWGMDILSYPSELPAFCRLVRATPEGALGCRLCDQKACRQARRERKTQIYPCHAGLIEAITPIQVDGVVVGYLLLSHIVQGADEEAEWQRARELCQKYGIPEDALYDAYRQLPRTPYRILRAAGDLLSFSAQALCQAQMARLVPGSLQERLTHFVSEHLAEDLSSERICTALGVGRTALYELSKQTYGCGIHEYVRRLRIQYAMRLLTTTKLTNSEICQRIGMADYNYFFRVFRQQTGFTPQAYRKQFAETGQ